MVNRFLGFAHCVSTWIWNGHMLSDLKSSTACPNSERSDKSISISHGWNRSPKHVMFVKFPIGAGSLWWSWGCSFRRNRSCSISCRGYYDEPHSKDAWEMVINPLTGSYIPIEYGIDRIDDHTLSTMFWPSHIYLDKLHRPHCEFTEIMVSRWNHPQNDLYQLSELLQLIQIYLPDYCLLYTFIQFLSRCISLSFILPLRI